MKLVDLLQAESILSPAFSAVGDLVLLADACRGGIVDTASFPDLTSVESFCNHIPILDLADNAATSSREPFYNKDHADFLYACEIANAIAESWAAKLRNDYPSRSFAVYSTTCDCPVVRFHSIRPSEPHWMASVDHIDGYPKGLKIVLHGTSDSTTPNKSNG